jgi:hypothetical protein
MIQLHKKQCARARVKEGWHDKAGDTMSGEYICSFLYLQAFVPRLFGTYLREAYLLPPHRACIYMIRDVTLHKRNGTAIDQNMDP